MVGMEDGPYSARHRADAEEDPLFSEPPALFLGDDNGFLGDDNGDGSYRDGERDVSSPTSGDASWEYELDDDDEFLENGALYGDGSTGDLLPAVGLFTFDDDDEHDILFGSVDLLELSEDGQNADTNPKPSQGVSSELGPSWTDTRAAAPPVVLHPAPAVDSEWSQAPADGYLRAPADVDELDDKDDVDETRSFRKSRRFNRVLMILTVLVMAGVVGAVYQYLNREQTTQTTTSDSGESETQPSADGADGADSADGTSPGAASGSGSAVALTGPDPVGILTTTGGVRIVTSTETESAAAEYADPSMGTPAFLGLSDTTAFIVNEEGMAWRVNFRTDPTPQSLVDLNKDNATPPSATTVYHFASADDGTIYFTDVNGNLWQLDPTPKATLVYSPASPEAAIAQLAPNATTLYIRTIGGDVYRHDHGGEGATFAYGPSNENPTIISIAPTPSGVILTAGGGLVRVVDPSKEDPLSVIYKPGGDKGVQAVAAGSGAAVVTASGNVVYAVLDAKNVTVYTADAGADQPPVTDVVALGDGTIGAVDNDGSLWTLDLSTESPTKIWDAASLGPVASVQPNQDVFAVVDGQGNVWSIPATAGAVPQQLSAAADARAIATGFFNPSQGSN